MNFNFVKKIMRCCCIKITSGPVIYYYFIKLKAGNIFFAPDYPYCGEPDQGKIKARFRPRI